MGTYLNPQRFKYKAKVLPKRIPPSIPLYYSDYEHQSDMDHLETIPASAWAIRNGLLDNENTVGGGHYIRVRGLQIDNVFIRFRCMVRHDGGCYIYLNRPGTVVTNADGDGYGFGIAVGGDIGQVFRSDDGTTTTLSSVGIVLENNILYPIELLYRDGYMLCRVLRNGTWYECEATDLTYTPPFEVGTWCQYDAAFDWIEVHRA